MDSMLRNEVLGPDRSETPPSRLEMQIDDAMNSSLPKRAVPLCSDKGTYVNRRPGRFRVSS
ncbi:hypothetical protein E4U54_008714 [Claviceps lovelessii]|nr:hypothetical protein E4U54_008714 [Claviceps lovelessii]